ncbi:TPA: helix-turn-helix domain-containing protein, partial [Streptococcus suis]
NYLSCSQSFYSRIESGTRELPVDILIKLSNLYSVSTDYLLHLTDFRKRIQK